MHAVGKGVIGLGPAGGVIAQNLGAVQELVAVFLAHLHQCGVVGVHLCHGQVGVFPLLVQRRNGADDDIAVGPRGFNRFEPLQIGGYVVGGVRGRAAEVVGAVADDDTARLEHGHGLRHGVHGGGTLEFFAFQRGDGSRAHADNADAVADGGKGGVGFIGVHCIAHRVGIADEQGFLRVAAPGILRLGQHRADLRRSRLGGGGRRGLRRGGVRGGFGGGRGGQLVRFVFTAGQAEHEHCSQQSSLPPCAEKGQIHALHHFS